MKGKLEKHENDLGMMRYCRSCGRVFDDGQVVIDMDVNNGYKTDKTDDELLMEAMLNPGILNSLVERCPFCGSDLNKIDMEDEII